MQPTSPDPFRRLTRQAIDQPGVALTRDGPGSDTLRAELRLANGASAYLRPGEHECTTREHVVRILVLFAVLACFSSPEPPVDLAGLGMPPLA
jgi:hypothetical protein